MSVSARKESTGPDPVPVVRPDLQAAIEEAETAAAEIAKRDTQRAVAEKLTELKRQATSEQEQAEADAALEAARADAVQQLETVKEAAASFRKRYAAVLGEIGTLIGEYKQVESVRNRTYRELHAVAMAAQQIRDGWQPGEAVENAYTGIPMELQDPSDMATEWRSVGGMDGALACLPQGDNGRLSYELTRIIKKPY